MSHDDSFHSPHGQCVPQSLSTLTSEPWTPSPSIRAVELLKRYYQGELTGLEDDDDGDEEDEEEEQRPAKLGEKKAGKRSRGDADDDGAGDDGAGGSKLLTETLAPRTNMPPLLINLAERKPERLHYLGVW